MSLVFASGQGLRYDVICTLDTAAVTELYGGLTCFLALLPRSFVLVCGLREANVAIFCGSFSWSRQTSLSKGFSYYFHDSTTELYFRSTTRQFDDVIPKQNTKENLIHVTHGKTKRQQIVFHN